MDYELNTGAVPSPKDDRDFQLHLIAGASLPETLPTSTIIDVTGLPVWMQNKIGACVGHAWAKSQQRCELVETGKVVALSARFAYAVSKCLDNTDGEGTYPRMTGEVLRKYGCATEATVPNDTTLDHETYVYQRQLHNIPQSAFLEATQYGIAGYAFSPSTEQGIKQAIYYAAQKRQGVVMLMKVGDTMWKDVNGNSTWDADKILPLRVPTSLTSGHEVYPYGYEYINGRLAIHFLNSWSDAWGDHGKGWFYFDEWQALIPEILTSIDKADVPAKVFNKNLTYGMTDPDVKLLQKFLNAHGYTVAHTGLGSPGMETDYFGTLTLNAVKAFQGAYLLPNTGFFGPQSRQVANSLS